MEFKTQLLKIIEYSGLSNTDFADLIDVQRASISHILSGRNKASLDFISKIKKQFSQFSWDWLIHAEGEMLIENVKSESKTTNTSSLPDLFNYIDHNIVNEKSIPTITNVPSKDNSNQENISNIRSSNEINAPRIKRIVFFYEDGNFELYQP